jgi:hypothetical protein
MARDIFIFHKRPDRLWGPPILPFIGSRGPLPTVVELPGREAVHSHLLRTLRMNDIFINCRWVATRWQQFSTHLHTNNTQNDTKQTIHRTTQKFRNSAGRAPSLRVLPWHLPYNWGKSIPPSYSFMAWTGISSHNFTFGLRFWNNFDMVYFINWSWVATRWQQFSTHLHTNNTQNDTKQTIHRTTQKFRNSAVRAPSLRVLPWHLPYNWGKSTEKPQSG